MHGSSVACATCIADVFPSHGVLGEEEGPSDLDAEHVWVLDPIDGTAAFIAGMPVYGTLIALMQAGEPIIGIIDHPITGERWLGVKGSETLYNGRPCRTRRCGSLGEAIMSASNPDFFDDGERPALDAMRTATAWRIWGGACMSYGRLASGRIDVALDTSLKLWDFAPFRPIIEGAGGVITDWQGAPITQATGPRILAAGDPARHREGLALVAACHEGLTGLAPRWRRSTGATTRGERRWASRSRTWPSRMAGTASSTGCR